MKCSECGAITVPRGPGTHTIVPLTVHVFAKIDNKTGEVSLGTVDCGIPEHEVQNRLRHHLWDDFGIVETPADPPDIGNYPKTDWEKNS